MLQYLTIKLENGFYLYFSKDTWNQIHQYKQKGLFSKENGGIFLGKEYKDSIEIIDATIPQEDDVRSRFSFNRRSNNHQKIAMDRWLKSESTATYLGEWHTHPQKHATPSKKDLNEWEKKLSHFLTPLVLVIIGTETDWIGIKPPNANLYEVSFE